MQLKGLTVATESDVLPVTLDFQAVAGTTQFTKTTLHLGDACIGTENVLPAVDISMLSTVTTTTELLELSIDNAVSSSVAALSVVKVYVPEWIVLRNERVQQQITPSNTKTVGSVAVDLIRQHGDVWRSSEVHLLEVAAKKGGHASCYTSMDGALQVLAECIEDGSVTITQLNFHDTLKHLRYRYSTSPTACVRRSEVAALKALQRGFKLMQEQQLLQLSGTVTALTDVRGAVTNSVQ
eukprot:19060-Heterococcus_DN1.PRE.1